MHARLHSNESLHTATEPRGTVNSWVTGIFRSIQPLPQMDSLFNELGYPFRRPSLFAPRWINIPLSPRPFLPSLSPFCTLSLGTGWSVRFYSILPTLSIYHLLYIPFEFRDVPSTTRTNCSFPNVLHRRSPTPTSQRSRRTSLRSDALYTTDAVCFANEPHRLLCYRLGWTGTAIMSRFQSRL